MKKKYIYINKKLVQRYVVDVYPSKTEELLQESLLLAKKQLKN